MVATAIPTSDINTHHMTLSDGTTTLGLILCDAYGNPIKGAIEEQASPSTAMQVSNSGGGYDNYLQPYSPIPQVDWSGGLGIEYADQDMTRYAEGNACDTSLGKIMPAGEKTLSTGYKSQIVKSGSNTGQLDASTVNAPDAVASDFTPSANITVRSVTLSILPTLQSFSMSVSIYSDAAGAPNVALGSAYYNNVPGSYALTLNFVSPISLTASTKYHLVIQEFSSIANFYYYGSSAGTTIKAYAGAWSTLYSNSTIAFTLNSSGIGSAYFFELNGLLHAISRGDDGSAPKLWRNGNIATIRATTTDNTKMLTGLGFSSSIAGAIVKIVAGPGVNESQPWRVITSNTTTGTNDTITVSPAWNTAHTTATRFVLMNINTWIATGIGTFAPTKPITSVCVVDEKVYLAQGVDADVGTAANVCRLTMSVASTGPTYTGGDEGYQRDSLIMFVDTDGKKRVFSAIHNTSAVYKSDIATPLSWTQVNNSLAVGSSESRITGLQVYDDPQRPFVFKEDGFGSISADVYGPIPISNAMKAVRSTQNGMASCTNDRFLYFSMGEKLLRYYSGDLRNIGPDLDQGLPSARRGNVVDIVAYPGGVLYAAIDAGTNGYSSILKYNGSGWCEVYRASQAGIRIRRLHIQNIPGLQYQRLWFCEEEDLCWIPIASNPLQASGFPFAASCSLTTGWYRTGYKDIQKFWNAVKLFLVNNSAARTALVEYRTDTSTSWSTLGTFTTAAPSQEIEFNATTTVANDVTGVRIQLRITLVTNSATTPVYAEQMVLQSVTRVPTKKAWVVTARIFDQSHNLLGNMDNLSAADIKTILEGWANSESRAKRLLVRSGDFSVWDQKRVFIEPVSYKPLKADAVGARRVGLLARFRMVEA